MSGVLESGEVLSVETPESVAFHMELAGLGTRGLALLLDTIAVAALIIGEFALTLVVVYLAATYLGFFSWWVLGGFAVVAFATYWGYFIYGEVARNGRTWGKRRMGLRVVRDDGGQVRFTDSAIRNLLRIVDLLPGWYGVGMVSALASSKGKRLGDLAAGTVVVRDSGEIALGAADGRLRPADVLARDFFARRGDLGDAARYQVAVEVLAAYGEEPGTWDEPTICGRIAQLSGETGGQAAD